MSGENGSAIFNDSTKTGSSPRERGKPRARGYGIPGSGAHPRVSGENALGLTCLALLGGSSPRERGKRLIEFIGCDLTRLIPA